MGGMADENLRRAVENRDIDGVKAALTEGADPLAIWMGTMTVLHVAARDGRTKVVRLLLEKAR